MFYSVPMLLLVGWRGEPNFKDEPQHLKQGKVTTDLLDAIKIPYEILSPEMSSEDAGEVAKKMVERAFTLNTPCILLIKKATFNS